MKRRFLTTVEAVRDGRKEKGWTQAKLAAKLAAKVGVDAQLVAELEAGHMCVELEKALGVLKTLDIYAVAVPSFPSCVSLEDINLDKELRRFS